VKFGKLTVTLTVESELELGGIFWRVPNPNELMDDTCSTTRPDGASEQQRQ
jgi:hypothetical protein